MIPENNELTGNDKAAIKVWSDYSNKTNIEYTSIIYQKIDLLSELMNSLHEKNIQLSDWLSWSEPMTYKLAFHSSSLLQLFLGTKINLKAKEFFIFDEPSAIVLFRTIVENYLTFYYLYCDKIEDEEKQFRINVWKYCGLKQRTGFEVSSKESKEKQSKELLHVDELKILVSNSRFYTVLKKEEQKQILRGTKPRLLNNWDNLMMLCGFRPKLFKDLYGYKSNYSHSEFISVFQIKSKSFGLNLKHKEHFILFLLHSIICKCILDLKNLFPSIKDDFEKKDEALIKEIEFAQAFITDHSLDKQPTTD